MLIRNRPDWYIPEGDVTPEHLFRGPRPVSRRALLQGAGAVAALASLPGAALAQRRADLPDPSLGLYPFKRNEAYQVDRALTAEKDATTYNNFYEYGTDKGIWRQAQQLRLRPWEITIDGLVEQPRKVAIDDLLKAMPLEERVYRMRCVEAWSMTIPWSGFPIASFVEWAKPKPEAKYIRMETFNDPSMAPGMAMPFYPWPYVEGLTMEEARNELAFFATGAYGKPVKQMGAPIRLVAPWKYGFKGVKSIVKITFTAARPVGLWEKLQKSEYGFWANVNPDVAHPRWSQATEEVIGAGNRVPTRIWNGYGEQVAHLYKDMKGERLFM